MSDNIKITQRIISEFLTIYDIFPCKIKLNQYIYYIKDILLTYEKGKSKKTFQKLNTAMNMIIPSLFESKNFLTKTYLSSSQNERITLSNESKNQNIILNDDSLWSISNLIKSKGVLKISKLSWELIKSILILIWYDLIYVLSLYKIESDITNDINVNIHDIICIISERDDIKDGNSSENGLMIINILYKIEKVILNESKSYEYRLLHLFLNFILKAFSPNIKEIQYMGTSTNRIDQVDIMLKNGVILEFINNSINNKPDFLLEINNKLEFINENIHSRIYYNYINSTSKESLYKNRPLKSNHNGLINDIITSDNFTSDDNNELLPINKQLINNNSVIFNNISIFDILKNKFNMKKLCIYNITLDKNYLLEIFITCLEQNNQLEVIEIDRFTFIPLSIKKRISVLLLAKTNLKKIKVIILNSDIFDIENFMKIFIFNSSLSDIIDISFVFQRIKIDLNTFIQNSQLLNTVNKSIFNNSMSNLINLSLIFDSLEFSLGDYSFMNTLIRNFSSLQNLAIGKIGMEEYKYILKSIINMKYELKSIRLIFRKNILDESEDFIKGLINNLLDCYTIKSISIENVNVNREKFSFDEELKYLFEMNNHINSLYIKSESGGFNHHIKGFNYYVYPESSFYLLFALKMSKTLKKIYNKKGIVKNVLDYYRIKKEKDIYINYSW